MFSANGKKGVKKKGSQCKKAVESISCQSNPSQDKPSSSENSKNYNQTLAEAEMDLLYAQYLQMVAFESKAKKTLLSRSHHAMETFLKLSCLIMQYVSSIQSQTFSLQLISILIKIFEHIQKQENILKPILKTIPTLTEKYRNLAGAVNVVKNKLLVKDVLPPDLGHEGDVRQVLDEMQAFLVEFFEQDPQYRGIIWTVDSTKSYVDSGRIISDALKRGLDLIEDARYLYFSEASLALSTAK